MRTTQHDGLRLGRRAILKAGTLCLTAGVVADGIIGQSLCADEPESVLRVGLITDLHHADKPPKGTRFYRESLGKLAEAAKQFTTDKINFVVELGDIIDAADSVEVEMGYLSTVNREYSAIAADRHYVLGNHCVDTLTKAEFLGAVGQEKSYYSLIEMATTSLCWTHVSARTASPMVGIILFGAIPAFRKLRSIGCVPT